MSNCRFFDSSGYGSRRAPMRTPARVSTRSSARSRGPCFATDAHAEQDPRTADVIPCGGSMTENKKLVRELTPDENEVLARWAWTDPAKPYEQPRA